MLNRVGWAAAAAALALTALAASPAHATGVSLQGNAGDDSMQATSGRGQVQIEGDAGNDTMDAGSAGGGSLLIAGDGVAPAKSPNVGLSRSPPPAASA